MNWRGLLFYTALLLTLTTQHLPAPVLEEEKPTATPSKPKAAKQKESLGGASEAGQKSTRGFDGTWSGSWSGTFQGESVQKRATLVIRGGNTAEVTDEITSTLGPNQQVWGNLPEPYNAIRTLTRKWKSVSSDLSVNGSNLRVRWPGGQLLDWSPKTIPYNVIEPISKYAPAISVYTLKGNQLTREFDSNGGVVYNRMK